jgi:hypothetical protein
MKACVLILALTLALVSNMCGRARLSAFAPSVSGISAHESSNEASPTPTPKKIDFDTQIKPILQAKCAPCHFSGGTMYQRLPFDRAETIKTLGTKLFTRIKDENEQRLIREFLAQQSE